MATMEGVLSRAGRSIRLDRRFRFPCRIPSAVPTITLDYGADDPLVLDLIDGTSVDDLVGPLGVEGEAARRLVTAAVSGPSTGPPLQAHVVPGDRVVVAVAGDVPQVQAVAEAVAERLSAAGVVVADITLLQAAPLDPEPRVAGLSEAVAGIGSQSEFDPNLESGTSYLAADEAGRPLYVARPLADADVVVAVGAWTWNAAFGGRGLDGELWPTFSRRACRQELSVALARRGRQALGDWRTSVQEITWQLGVCASLRLVPGTHGSLHAACFGLPDEAARQARTAAAAWSPHVAEPTELAVAAVARAAPGFAAVTRALAAAARVSQPGGTICLVSRLAEAPGIVFQRWRQGAPLDRLVHEAVASRDPLLIADALQTRLFARALGDRRLVLLSALDESTVEDLEFGYAAAPDDIERLAGHAESVAVLHEADLMLPQPRI